MEGINTWTAELGIISSNDPSLMGSFELSHLQRRLLLKRATVAGNVTYVFIFRVHSQLLGWIALPFHKFFQYSKKTFPVIPIDHLGNMWTAPTAFASWMEVWSSISVCVCVPRYRFAFWMWWKILLKKKSSWWKILLKKKNSQIPKVITPGTLGSYNP